MSAVIDGTSTTISSRELTEAEIEERSEECFELEGQIKQCIAIGRAAAWDLCRYLHEFDQRQGWLARGVESQTEWLAQPEIGITRTMYFRMIRRHRELVLNREVPEAKLLELEPSKIDMVLPAIEANALPLDEVITDVTTMGARDLREKYVGVTTPNTPKEKAEKEEPVGELTEEEKAAETLRASLEVSATNVDSWVSLGGDRRKAQRHMSRIMEDHPLFAALTDLQSTLAGEEDALPRADVLPIWETVVTYLNLDITEA